MVSWLWMMYWKRKCGFIFKIYFVWRGWTKRQWNVQSGWPASGPTIKREASKLGNKSASHSPLRRSASSVRESKFVYNLMNLRETVSRRGEEGRGLLPGIVDEGRRCSHSALASRVSYALLDLQNAAL